MKIERARFVERRGAGLREEPNARRRAGTSLIELLVILVLLGAAAVLGDLFVVSYRANVDSTKRLETINKLEGLVSVLRRDVWSAGAISHDGNLLLLNEGAERVLWKFGEDGGVVRTRGTGGAEEIRRWDGLPAMRVETVKGTVALEVGAKERVTLVSQRVVATGGGGGR